MALTSADLAQLGPGAQKQILAKYEKYGIEVTEI